MKQLKFIGERMIPEVNKGATLYYEHPVRYLGVCSQKKLNNFVASAILTPSADFIDLTKGTQFLSQQIQELRLKNQKLTFEVENFNRILGEITSAKTFKAWQAFVIIKKSLYKMISIKHG